MSCCSSGIPETNRRPDHDISALVSFTCSSLCLSVFHKMPMATCRRHFVFSHPSRSLWTLLILLLHSISTAYIQFFFFLTFFFCFFSSYSIWVLFYFRFFSTTLIFVTSSRLHFFTVVFSSALLDFFHCLRIFLFWIPSLIFLRFCLSDLLDLPPPQPLVSYCVTSDISLILFYLFRDLFRSLKILCLSFHNDHYLWRNVKIIKCLCIDLNF